MKNNIKKIIKIESTTFDSEQRAEKHSDFLLTIRKNESNEQPELDLLTNYSDKELKGDLAEILEVLVKLEKDGTLNE